MKRPYRSRDLPRRHPPRQALPQRRRPHDRPLRLRLPASMATTTLNAQDHPRKPPEAATLWMEGAKMVVSWNGKKTSPGRRHIIANLAKGGSLKIFDADGPIARHRAHRRTRRRHRRGSPPRPARQLHHPASGPRRRETTFRTEGDFCRRKPNLMTSSSSSCSGMATAHRPLQRQPDPLHNSEDAITGKPKLPYRFQRSITIYPNKSQKTSSLRTCRCAGSV